MDSKTKLVVLLIGIIILLGVFVTIEDLFLTLFLMVNFFLFMTFNFSAEEHVLGKVGG